MAGFGGPEAPKRFNIGPETKTKLFLEDDRRAMLQAWPKNGATTFQTIPKYWLWQWYTDHSDMSVSFAEKVERVDRTAVRKISEYVFAVDGRTVIPKEIAEDTVAVVAFDPDAGIEPSSRSGGLQQRVWAANETFPQVGLPNQTILQFQAGPKTMYLTP